jgi:hypothetical protein
VTSTVAVVEEEKETKCAAREADSV